MGGTSRGLVTAATCAVVLAGCSAPSTPSGCGGPEPAEGARVLLDGTPESLERWRMAGPGGFEVAADCAVRTVGGMGLLWFPEELTDYRLAVEWRAPGDDNSGVFVGFPDPGDDPWVAVREGYEIQIDLSDAPDRTTGAVYGVQGADIAARDAALNPAGEWNTLDVVVSDPRVTVSINGVVVNELVSTDPARDLSGHVGLQNHGEDDEVHFRNVVLTPLTD